MFLAPSSGLFAMRKLDTYELRRWLEFARPGDEAIYWVGVLSVDRASNRKLFVAALALLRLSDAGGTYRSAYSRRSDKVGTGCVRLFQKRNEFVTSAFDHIVRVVRKPTAEELEKAFGGGRFA